jgi:hypothetical protein
MSLGNYSEERMQTFVSATPDAEVSSRRATPLSVPARSARAALLLVVVVAAVAGAWTAGTQASGAAVADAGADLTHLLRAMAALKTMMAAAAIAAILWRLGTAVSPMRLVLYALACGGMAAGPGLIWSMAYVRTGALLLHAGLLAGIVLLWRDPDTARKLSHAIAARRRELARRF